MILEYLTENGASHIREIHLSVTEIRENIPQHTIRARLSELSRNINLEEKLSSFGNGFYGLYEDNPDMTSVVSYPDRGPWGDSTYRGNCSGHLVKDLILRFNSESVFDPAEGSGTVRDVVSGINQYRKRNIRYEGRDLKSGSELFSSDLPKERFDMVWFHPPYWDIIKYSDNPKDLSNCQSLAEFEEKLSAVVERLSSALKPGGIMAILIGDKRKNGEYFPLMRTLLGNHRIGQLKAIIIKIQHHCRSDRQNYSSKNPFLIPIKHEYCLIFEKHRG